jgi:hypothetical protein
MLFLLSAMAATVSKDGKRREKPSVYFNPMAQPTSKRPARKR